MIVFRRYLAFLLLLAIYLPSSAGLAISAHFCMGELASLSINTSESKSCECSPGLKKSCCADTFIYYKINVDQTATSKVSAAFKVSLTSFASPLIPRLGLEVKKSYLPTFNSDYPPPNRTVLLQVFRI